nr:hypothetical protein CFP56_63349 [Quercus suber]
MSQLSNSLVHALQRNNELLSTLAETDHALGTLKQNVSYISDLNSQIKVTDAELAKLHTVTETERKDHVSYRDSKIKRFAYKLGGKKGKDKFSAMEEKEEREFLEAWQKEREATDRRAELSTALSQAENDKARLEQEMQRHDSAQSELDQMYASIFSGPTPEIDGEDQMEQAVTQSREYHSQMQQVLENEKKAFAALRQADRHMGQAAVGMSHALEYSSYDMIGGGAYADMAERESLSQAQNCVIQANHNLIEARRRQPAVIELSGVEFPHGHGISDVLFDNIFTDMVKRATAELQAQVQQQQQRVAGARSQANQAASSLEEARKELQRIRAEAFERVTASGGVGHPDVPIGWANTQDEQWRDYQEPLPAYSDVNAPRLYPDFVRLSFPFVPSYWKSRNPLNNPDPAQRLYGSISRYPYRSELNHMA